MDFKHLHCANDQVHFLDVSVQFLKFLSLSKTYRFAYEVPILVSVGAVEAVVRLGQPFSGFREELRICLT